MTIHIGHFYGRVAFWEEMTGYKHGEKTKDHIETVVKGILNAGLNVQIIQHFRTEEDGCNQCNLKKPIEPKISKKSLYYSEVMKEYEVELNIYYNKLKASIKRSSGDYTVWIDNGRFRQR